MRLHASVQLYPCGLKGSDAPCGRATEGPGPRLWTQKRPQNATMPRPTHNTTADLIRIGADANVGEVVRLFNLWEIWNLWKERADAGQSVSLPASRTVVVLLIRSS